MWGHSLDLQGPNAARLTVRLLGLVPTFTPVLLVPGTAFVARMYLVLREPILVSAVKL